jgi:cell division protease FtsH
VNNSNRNIFLWVFIALFTFFIYFMFQGGNERAQGSTLAYSEFVKAVDQSQVSHVEMKGNKILGTLFNGTRFSVEVPNDPGLVDRLLQNNVSVNVVPLSEGGSFWGGLLTSLLPIIIIIGIWMYILRQMQSGNNRALGFGKSRAKLLTEKQGRITFNDVAGVDEAKQEVEEIVDYLKDPRKFQKLGGKIPKGVLLVGSPGTGKTLLARAIAGEAEVPFFSISGSDFVEMFVGVGASRVRDLFEQGKKNAPCIIFIDEIDAVGRHRGTGIGGGNDEREQTLNQLLVEMDGFDTNEGVILIAATNRPDVLDPALLRPGRFDRQVVVPLPDILGREQIIQVHMAKVPVAQDVNILTLARGTPGFSGADLANLVNEAALIAARQNKRVVTMSDFEYAKDKIMMGPERRSMVMTDDEKKVTAYHEAGHALMCIHAPGADPIHKATIIPRGHALGMVMRLPERDQISQTRQQLHANIAIAIGGRVAEELIFGHDKVTTGAQSDIEYATRTARSMVTRWGLSDKMGFLAYSDTQQQHIADKTAEAIDLEVRRLVEESYLFVTKTLQEHMADLHMLAENLLEYETLTGPEINQLLAGKPLNRDAKLNPDANVAPRSSIPRAGATKKSSSQTAETKPDAVKKSKGLEDKGASKSSKKPAKED